MPTYQQAKIFVGYAYLGSIFMLKDVGYTMYGQQSQVLIPNNPDKSTFAKECAKLLGVKEDFVLKIIDMIE